MRSTRLALLAAATIAATGLAIAPAQAASTSHLDARHDVYSYDWDSNAAPVAVPSRRDGDITRVRTDFRRHWIHLQMNFVELRRTDHPRLHVFQILTSRGKTRELVLLVDHKYPNGVTGMITEDSSFVRCRIVHRISYRHNRVDVGFPATCLHRPRWIRVGFGEAVSGGLRGAKEFVDDGYADGLPKGDNLTYGPEVSRG